MKYCLIPIAELTQAMINRSTSNISTQIRQITISEISYYIVEFAETTASTFDNYQWLSLNEIKTIIEANI